MRNAPAEYETQRQLDLTRRTHRTPGPGRQRRHGSNYRRRQVSLAAEATHRFRASGWTRHYETYSEILQMLAQLALGAGRWQISETTRFNRRSKLASVAFALLRVGHCAHCHADCFGSAGAIGVAVISWRALGEKARVLSLAGLCLFIAFGAFVVYQTRARHALPRGSQFRSAR